MILVVAVLFISFFILLFMGVPISIAVGISSLLSLVMVMPFDLAAIIGAQKIFVSLDSFALMAIPLFILSGNLMNHGKIAIRLVNLVQLFFGKIPGSLNHVNIAGNMLFGSISGSAVASATAIGGILNPLQKKSNYNPVISACANITSCPSGLLIPPSNAFIIFSLISGGTSVAALFVAGYIPGILWGITIMLVTALIGRKYALGDRVYIKLSFKEKLIITYRALPSLLLVFIVIGGIIAGIFTATESSVIAVVYTFILAFFFYKSLSRKDLIQVLKETSMMTGIVFLLIGCSSIMSWVMAYTSFPKLVNDFLLNFSDNKYMFLILINIILLVVGMFMDMTPALLIFTPILLPLANFHGIDNIHFAIIMIFNLSIGICTPPVGSAMFVGCSLAGVSINKVIKPLLIYVMALIVLLMIISYFPSISLFLPKFFGLM